MSTMDLTKHEHFTIKLEKFDDPDTEIPIDQHNMDRNLKDDELDSSTVEQPTLNIKMEDCEMDPAITHVAFCETKIGSEYLAAFQQHSQSSTLSVPTDLPIPHDKETAYFCDICDQVLTDEHEVILHTNYHVRNIAPEFNESERISVNNQLCDVRDSSLDNIFSKSFPQTTEMSEQTVPSSSSPEKNYHCQFCTKSFSRNSYLVIHTRTHTGEKPYKCDVCEKSFGLGSDLVKHIRIHTGEKPYECETCSRAFSQKIHLVRHRRSHSGEKPYTCEICNKTFAYGSDLVRHKRNHTGERPFQCQVCQAAFSQKVNLVSHIRSHTGEKPFECDICNKSFSRKPDLVSHKRIHSGEKPYQCEICKKSFSQRCSLIYHKRSQHPDELQIL